MKAFQVIRRWKATEKVHYTDHNERDGVSDHQSHECLLKRLFRRRSKKTSKLRVTGLCEGNSPVTGEFPAQRASNAEDNFHLMTSSGNFISDSTLIIKLSFKSIEPYLCSMFVINLLHNMMMSSNGNIFRVTGPLWEEFTGHRWIPLTKASDAELWCFLWSKPEQTVE